MNADTEYQHIQFHKYTIPQYIVTVKGFCFTNVAILFRFYRNGLRTTSTALGLLKNAISTAIPSESGASSCLLLP